MPYAEPTSPSPSDTLKSPRPLVMGPAGATHDGSPFITSSTGPMPGIPRRSASTSSSPRKNPITFTPRHVGPVVTGALAAMRAVESLRRPSPQPSQPVGALGLKLPHHHHHQSPRSAGANSSSDSSAILTTPEDNHIPLPLTTAASHSGHSPPKISLLQRQRQTRQRALSNSSNISASSNDTAPASPRPHHQMVRKKSGEVVKSSLKQRSMSTPDLGRGEASSDSSPAHTRSSHNLRERTKSVRFDDLGLESVVVFLRGQKVTAVSKAAENGDGLADGEDQSDTDLSDYVHFRTRRSGAASRSGGDDKNPQIQIETHTTVPRVRLDFGPGTEGLLKNEYVVLERLEMQNGTPLMMRGTVLARNMAFDKWVAVRFTLDGWQTVSEVSAQHVCHIPAGTTGDEGWDRFSFSVRLEDYKRKIEERSLHLCVRFSVDGHEWWDSNEGKNYSVSFKRAIVVRPPVAAPVPAHGPSLFQSPRCDSPLPEHPHPHLRLLPRTSPSHAKSPRNWIFPRTAADKVVERSDSPQLSPPPPVSFKPPAPPDVHTHLRLKKYCAPSPPQSPPKRMHLPQLPPLVLSLAPVRATATPGGSGSGSGSGAVPVAAPAMDLIHGHPATTWSPHERSHSWAGKSGEAWQQQNDKQSASDNDESVGGDSTPRAARARSPETRAPEKADMASMVDSPVSITNTSSSSGSEDETDRPVTLNRSTGDLRALINQDASNGLMTPPSSNLSSPPTPSAVLPGPMSPSMSMSTGDSSPVNTLISGSPAENDSLDEARGRTLNAATYQEFLDKFCFFKSPPSVTTPLEGVSAYTRPNYISNSGYSSPYYGYFGAHATATPTQLAHDGADGGYPLGQSASSTGSGATPRASPPTRSPASNAFPLPCDANTGTSGVPLTTA